MTVLLWISLGIGCLWILLFASGLRQAGLTPALRPSDPAPAPRYEFICVMIPARDEEANIADCVKSMLAQTHKSSCVLVVDDRSRDGTAEAVRGLAAEDARVMLLQAPEPQAGWVGKCHALHAGLSKLPEGAEWICFVDADTRHHPELLARALEQAHEAGADLLSLVPHLEGRSFWERLVQPSVAALIAMFNKPSAVNDPARPEAFANGQFILVRTEVHRALGGHKAVAGKVLEDVELAKIYKRAGRRIHLAIGRDLFSTRMYSGLGSLIQGWTKNLYLLVQSRLTRAALAVGMSVVLSAWPMVFGLWALTALLCGLRPLPAWGLWSMLAVYLMVLAFQVGLRAINRWYPAYALLAPLANLVVAVILIRSAWLHRRGLAVDWKGRQVHNQESEP